MKKLSILFSGLLLPLMVEASYLIELPAEKSNLAFSKAVDVIHCNQFGHEEELNRQLDNCGARLTWVPPTLWDLNLIRLYFQMDKSSPQRIFLKDEREQFQRGEVLKLGSDSFLDFLRKYQIPMDTLRRESNKILEHLLEEISKVEVGSSQHEVDHLITSLNLPSFRPARELLRQVIDFEVKCYQDCLIPLYRTTHSFCDSLQFLGDRYAAIEMRMVHYHKIHSSESFLGFKGLSYSYSPLSGFLYDGTLGGIGGSLNTTPSACSFSYFLEYLRDLLFANQKLPESFNASNCLDLKPEELKQKMQRNVVYAISFPASEIQKYRQLFYLPDCPLYMGVLCRGEMFHPRMKGTYSNPRFPEVFNIAMLDQIKEPWSDTNKSSKLTLHTLINLCTWISRATFFVVDGQPVNDENRAIVEQVKTSQLALSRVIRQLYKEEKYQVLVDELLKISGQQTVIK